MRLWTLRRNVRQTTKLARPLGRVRMCEQKFCTDRTNTPCEEEGFLASRLSPSFCRCPTHYFCKFRFGRGWADIYPASQQASQGTGLHKLEPRNSVHSSLLSFFLLTLVKLLGALLVPLPAFFEALLGEHGEPLAQPVHRVDGARVVVDASRLEMTIFNIGKTCHLRAFTDMT